MNFGAVFRRFHKLYISYPMNCISHIISTAKHIISYELYFQIVHIFQNLWTVFVRSCKLNFSNFINCISHVLGHICNLILAHYPTSQLIAPPWKWSFVQVLLNFQGGPQLICRYWRIREITLKFRKTDNSSSYFPNHATWYLIEIIKGICCNLSINTPVDC